MAQSNNTRTDGWGRATASPRQLRQAGRSLEARPQPPIIQLVGDVDHPDFLGAIGLLRSDARITSAETTPELIVVAQSRPDALRMSEISRLQRAAPLAGIAALLGSWCEGETRTGRPWPGVQRLYWYEFPAWWHRQLQLRAAGCCPDWARPAAQLIRQCVPGHPRPRSGLVVLRTPRRDNADALADALNQAGHSTAWQRLSHTKTQIRGALAGIWDGGQLNDAETADLEIFCTEMFRDGVPVVVILDFPRRDRVDRAFEAGAAAVLGKPFLISDLIATLESIAVSAKFARAA